jgi:replicative DNA helicase
MNAVDDRQPPQALDAEMSVLGGMMLSKTAIGDVIEILAPRDFYRPAHATIYQTIIDLWERGEPADPVTVAAELNRRGQLVRPRRTRPTTRRLSRRRPPSGG